MTRGKPNDHSTVPIQRQFCAYFTLHLQHWNRLTCLKTTLDGWMKRESTQGTTFISVISSPSIFFLPQGNKQLPLNFLTCFTVEFLTKEKSTPFAGLTISHAMKHLSFCSSPLDRRPARCHSLGSRHVLHNRCMTIKILLRDRPVTCWKKGYSIILLRRSGNKPPLSRERSLIS